MDITIYPENIPLENLAALGIVVCIALFFRKRSPGLPFLIIIFYLAYMAIDYSYCNFDPECTQMTYPQESEFNMLCFVLGVIVIMACALMVQSNYYKIIVSKQSISGGKKLVFKWSAMIVTACYGVAIGLLWVVPFALQLLTNSYTWPIHAAIMDNMIYLDVGFACLAQLGRPCGDGLRETN